MRLYSLTGATRLDDAEYGTFDVDAAGGFDFPDEVSDRLASFHAGGKPMWENDIQRQQRLINEELERRKDPATLLGAVEALVKAAGAAGALTAAATNAQSGAQALADTLKTAPPAAPAVPVAEPAPAKPARKRASKPPAQ